VNGCGEEAASKKRLATGKSLLARKTRRGGAKKRNRGEKGGGFWDLGGGGAHVGRGIKNSETAMLDSSLSPRGERTPRRGGRNELVLTNQYDQILI